MVSWLFTCDFAILLLYFALVSSVYFGVVKLFFGVVKLPFVFLSVLLTLVILVYLLSLGGLALLVRALGFFTCVKPCWAGLVFGG